MDGDGLTQRDLLLEVRHDVRELSVRVNSLEKQSLGREAAAAGSVSDLGREVHDLKADHARAQRDAATREERHAAYLARRMQVATLTLGGVVLLSNLLQTYLH